jgi:hypothetical protein
MYRIGELLLLCAAHQEGGAYVGEVVLMNRGTLEGTWRPVWIGSTSPQANLVAAVSTASADGIAKARSVLGQPTIKPEPVEEPILH